MVILLNNWRIKNKKHKNFSIKRADWVKHMWSLSQMLRLLIPSRIQENDPSLQSVGEVRNQVINNHGKQTVLVFLLVPQTAQVFLSPQKNQNRRSGGKQKNQTSNEVGIINQNENIKIITTRNYSWVPSGCRGDLPPSTVRGTSFWGQRRGRVWTERLGLRFLYRWVAVPLWSDRGCWRDPGCWPLTRRCHSWWRRDRKSTWGQMIG